MGFSWYAGSRRRPSTALGGIALDTRHVSVRPQRPDTAAAIVDPPVPRRAGVGHRPGAGARAEQAPGRAARLERKSAKTEPIARSPPAPAVRDAPTPMTPPPLVVLTTRRDNAMRRSIVPPILLALL